MLRFVASKASEWPFSGSSKIFKILQTGLPLGLLVMGIVVSGWELSATMLLVTSKNSISEAFSWI
jgi:hypothetical protein